MSDSKPTLHNISFPTRSYDSLLVKVTAWAPTAEETIARMHRALWEFRVRGVVTNLRFLDQVITHPRFERADYTTKFTSTRRRSCSASRAKRDRATRLLRFMADVIVNDNPEVARRARPTRAAEPKPPRVRLADPPPPGTKQRLEQLGPRNFAQWMLEQERVLLTDTTFRDAHQSLLATRFRTRDMAAVAPAYARLVPQLFWVECWGGATFDVAMRFLKEDPWERLSRLREAVPNVLFQNDAVHYPTLSFKDRVVSVAISKAKEFGFRIVACASTGNLANSVAALAAAGGFESYIFVPYDLEQGKILGTLVYGTNLIGIKGSYDEVNRLCSEIAENYGWAFVNINIRPFYGEGPKTFGFEIAEQLGWRVPRHVVVPMAGGSLITKIWKGFKELEQIGLLDGVNTKIHGAQASGSSPITLYKHQHIL